MILLEAAKSRNEPLGHTLLHGPPGLGKTTLAYIIANEMGANAHIIMGPSLEKPSDVTAALGRLNPGDVIMIDEIHSASRAALEICYPAMEDRKMSFTLDCKTHTRLVLIDLPPFTLIGATTQPGLLDAPLRDRFSNVLVMQYYSDADLTAILAGNARTLGMVCDAGSLELLASRSRGTPRIANNLLRFSRDYATVEAARSVPRNGHPVHLTVSTVEKALKLQGIDQLGLNQADRDYLNVLIGIYKGGPVGAGAIASTLGLKEDSLTGVIEPFLQQRGLLIRTQHGRKSTEKAEKHLAAVTA